MLRNQRLFNPSTRAASKTPTLDRLLARGKVWINGSSFVGRASDGKVVNLGATDDRLRTELYLANHATPETW